MLAPIFHQRTNPPSEDPDHSARTEHLVSRTTRNMASSEFYLEWQIIFLLRSIDPIGSHDGDSQWGIEVSESHYQHVGDQETSNPSMLQSNDEIGRKGKFQSEGRLVVVD